MIAGLISSVAEKVGGAGAAVGSSGKSRKGSVSLVPEAPRRRLVVVGNGMVCARFCQELVALDLHRTFVVTVLGAEATPAYDRVNLAKVLRGRPVSDLLLLPAEWYSEHGIELRLGVEAVDCDLDSGIVVTSDGDVPFDELVFATGASPVVPKIEGADSSGVCVYRSEQDALALRNLALEFTDAKLPAIVIGAGLLGLEAASELRALGVTVELVESSEQLLPRQLDEATAAHVEHAFVTDGYRLRKGVRVSRIEGERGQLRVSVGEEEEVGACFVVIAAGVRARDELARKAGLACDLFGGIIVKDDLSCSKPHVYAIGECVRHRGVSFGLVAPGYQMAEALAQRLSGGTVRFAGSVTSTRLKSHEVELSVVGESNVDDLATQHPARDDDQGYRQLVVRRGRVIGLSVVGGWDEMHLAQQAVVAKRKLSRREIKRFEAGQRLFESTAIDLSTWPDTAPVCSCTGTTCGSLRGAFAKGANTPEALTKATGAGSVCGSCTPLLASLCGKQQAIPVQHSRTMVVATALAVVVSLWALLGPAIPYADSVQSGVPWDELWRSSTLKQVTGFSIVGLTLLGLLVSVRKRFKLLQGLEHRALRTFHIVMGSVILAALLAHTGFRLGDNLDLWLSSCFVMSVLVGGFAATFTALESRLGAERGGRLRRLLTRVHIWVVWPLPALTVAHVVKVYFF